jgi:hypothetical protein
MPTIQVEANLSADHLLNAARQLSRQELNQFVEGVLALRAQVNAPQLPVAESELLSKINQPVPVTLQQRYDALLARRDEHSLSPAEQQELLQLTDQVEALEAERMKHLLELAQLRHIPLAQLMRQLGLDPLPYL